MYAYYEVETNIPSNHELHIQLPDSIPAGRAICDYLWIYRKHKTQNNAGLALKVFLKKYQTEKIDIDTRIFDEYRKTDVDRDFRLWVWFICSIQTPFQNR